MNHSPIGTDNSVDGRHNIEFGNAGVSDSKVIASVLGGDISAFEILMRRYNQRLFRVARSILKNDADAEDALQEAYIKAYQKLKQYGKRGSFQGWLMRVVVNEALAKKRELSAKMKRISSSDAYIEETATESMGSDDMILPDQLAHGRALRRLIESAIDGLPDEFRTVFVLRTVEQMTIRETSDALGLEANTVKTRQHRALKRLRAQLDDMYQQQINDSFGFDGARCDRLVADVLSRIRPG